MTNKKMRSACEAILFASGEPVEAVRIAEALDIDNKTVSSLLSDLADELNKRESGICLLKLGSRYQLCSRVEYASQVRAVLEKKKNTPLSNAAFEVLAVVAYNQPVTKAYIEQIRGVDCTGVISTLCQRGLLEEKGRLELPGKPLLYGTTPDFLRCFCLESLSELPELPDRPENDDGEETEIDSTRGEQLKINISEDSALEEEILSAEKEGEE
ncbi:MAG: SMC-Scp complex subunit ScpB [Clostridia bacterium]|nr:SMC-Scp complex subunit ScpB [Clostridia bacterium]